MHLNKTNDPLLITVFLIISLWITGCSTNIDEAVIASHLLEIRVGGESISFTNDELVANENCHSIFLNTSYASINGERFRLEMAFTKSGRIREVSYIDLSGTVGVQFRSADFLASEVFTINNFQWSESDQTLSFDFDGTLYEVDNRNNTKIISGTMRTDQLEITECTIQNWEISASINNEPFNEVEVDGVTTNIRDAEDLVVSVESVWTGYSDDGFRIALVMSDDLKNIEPGQYSFDETNLTDYVRIEKYEGAYEAIESAERNGDWEGFEYVGELVIEEQLISPAQVTKGSFSFRALKNGEVVYTVTDGKFSI